MRVRQPPVVRLSLGRPKLGKNLSSRFDYCPSIHQLTRFFHILSQWSIRFDEGDMLAQKRVHAARSPTENFLAPDNLPAKINPLHGRQSNSMGENPLHVIQHAAQFERGRLRPCSHGLLHSQKSGWYPRWLGGIIPCFRSPTRQQCTAKS